jgi:hypothetical protein
MSKRRRPNRATREAATARDTDTAIEAQWERIPALDCQGKCHTTCGPIDMSVRERERILERHGIDIPHPPADLPISALPFTDCPALTMLKTCGAYENRPTICRLWGATEDLPCVYGCQPLDGQERLDTITAREIQTEVIYRGGPSPRDTELIRRSPVFSRAPTGPEMRRVMEANPVSLAAYQAHVAAGAAADARRAHDGR